MPKILYDAADAGDQFNLVTGRIIRRFYEMEVQMMIFLCMFLGVDQARANIIMGAIPSAKAQRELVKTLAKAYLDERFQKEFNALMKRASNLSRSRNSLVHDFVALNKIGKEIKVFSFQTRSSAQGFEFVQESFSLNEVTVLLGAIDALCKDIQAFQIRIENQAIHVDPLVHRSTAGN